MKTTIVVAVNHPPAKNKPESEADFYRVEIWGRMGETAHKYIGKGNQVTAVGRLVLDKWSDREGKARVTPVIHATAISLPPKPRPLPEEVQLKPRVQATNDIESEDRTSGEFQFSEAEEDAAAAAMFGEHQAELEAEKSA